MRTIFIFDAAGDFAENKDTARKLRTEVIEPELKSGGRVTLDFDKVTSATQSFVHALISEVIRNFGIDVLDKILFKRCNKKVSTIINIVVEYVQDGMFADPGETAEI